MTSEKQQYRGVFCFSCRQPIPLPAIVLHIESAGKDLDTRYADEPQRRVFSLRCRACDKEMPYRTVDIVEIEGTPKRRLTRAAKDLDGQRNVDFSRAANA
jgi:hypothetical protein